MRNLSQRRSPWDGVLRGDSLGTWYLCSGHPASLDICKSCIRSAPLHVAFVQNFINRSSVGLEHVSQHYRTSGSFSIQPSSLIHGAVQACPARAVQLLSYAMTFRNSQPSQSGRRHLPNVTHRWCCFVPVCGVRAYATDTMRGNFRRGKNVKVSIVSRLVRWAASWKPAARSLRLTASC